MTWINPSQAIIDWLQTPEGMKWGQDDLWERRHTSYLYETGQTSAINTSVHHQVRGEGTELYMPGMFSTKLSVECVYCRTNTEHAPDHEYTPTADLSKDGPLRPLKPSEY